MKRTLLAGLLLASIGTIAPVPVTGRVAAATPSFPDGAVDGDGKGALEHVVVLGASLSAGFGLSTDLAAALTASLREPHGAVDVQASEFFFTGPRAMAAAQVEFALDAEPSLVVALDFLFWFGYGAQTATGAPIEREDQRLELLEVGLEFLDELDGPLVIADFPDMSDAVGLMLAEVQMPAKETLERLSRRVHAWAEAREDTLVLPLAAAVRSLKGADAIVLGRHTWPAGTRLLQGDHLHPNLAGMVGVAQWVADALVTAGWAPEEAFTFDREAVLAAIALRRISIPVR